MVAFRRAAAGRVLVAVAVAVESSFASRLAGADGLGGGPDHAGRQLCWRRGEGPHRDLTVQASGRSRFLDVPFPVAQSC